MMEILNFNKESEQISYPLCLFRISGVSKHDTRGIIRNLSDDNENYQIYPVSNNGFNALISLKQGINEIEVACGNETINKSIYYRPPQHCRSVRLIYVTCLNEDKFQGPDNIRRDVNEAIKRIQVGTLLMQTFLGESLNGEGLGRKTFQLEMTKQGVPKVFEIQLPLTLEESHKLSADKLWETVAMQVLSSPLASRSCKYLAFFCGTRFINHQKRKVYSEKDILSMTKGHVSLGGGGLALVGTGTLYTWASHISEILDCFNSTKEINSQNLMDFSASRGTYGACYGTHLGSVLHELGHTFDLGHTTTGIMARGFEDFHLFFTITHVNISRNCLEQSNSRVSGFSSLIKDSLTFTTDFVRKESVENINMVVEPLKNPLVSSLIYSSSNSTKLNRNSSVNLYGSLSNINDAVSPCFEKFASSCLSQSVKNVEFTPKSPHDVLEVERFFHSPRLQLKSDSSKSASGFILSSNFPSLNQRDETQIKSGEKRLKCRAFWSRSNAVLLAYHKWINGNEDGVVPQLKG